MPPLPQTIGEVLNELDQIIETSIEQKDKLAIFAYVYRRTTAQIKTEIENQSFEDNARMEKFDVIFANRYITAYRQMTSGARPTESWNTAFEVRNEPLTILQHLMMGMNAHISFDLGIAAAEVAPGNQIQALKADFMKVNDILAKLVDEMQLRISKVSSALFLLDWVGGTKDEKFASFSIRGARQVAWTIACQLAAMDGSEQLEKINRVDRDIAKINERISAPRSRMVRMILRVIRFFEIKETGQILAALKSDLS